MTQVTLATIVESDNIITCKSICDATNLAKTWEHTKVECWAVRITHIAWCAFEGLARVMQRAGCGLRGRGAGRGVRCRVQWTTLRRTRSRRMINNENTAKQTVATRGMSGDAVRQSEHRRRPHRPRVRRCSRRAENRCTIRNRHPALIRNCDSNPWWVTSRRSHATTSRDSVNMRSTTA